MLKLKVRIFKNDVYAANGDKGLFANKYLVAGEVVELHVTKVVPWGLHAREEVPSIAYSLGENGLGGNYSPNYLPLECFEVL
jgi:hypothetical protein